MSWLGRLTAKLGFLGGAAAEPAGGQSRKIARERLSIILAHQRGANLLSEGQMQRLQEEVLESVKKYIAVDVSKPVSMTVKAEGNTDFIEMQVALRPEGGRRT